ncbi:MAG TPA: serine/threonine-protein kinase [Polyangiales bacterium]
MIGTVIGNFRIVSQLGKGGMGEVWLAEQQSLGTKAAIKILHPDVSVDATHVQRFFNEAIAVSKIRHAGIVKIFDCGHVGAQAYLVMELLVGETLTRRIARARRLPLAQVCDLGRQVASVLDATHAAGIIHRDLKPENVFLLADGRIKVLDFGAALSDNKPNEKAGTLGTPWYMAPEQAMGNAPDRRSDIYSLGCVLFEMITGNCPFDAADGRVVMAKHIEDPVPTPESPTGPLPEGLERAITRSLAKHPDQRQQSAAEFGRELSQAGAAMTRPGWRKWLAL